MRIDEKILNEIRRYKDINKYITEQDAPPPAGGTGLPPADAPLPPPPALAPAEGAAPPPAPEMGGEAPAGPPLPPPTPVDTEQDPDVEKMDEKEEGKQIEVTDLVDAQKALEQKQDEMSQTIMAQLDDLEKKLSVMDDLLAKIDGIENKIEKYRVKTPEEKLELRSLDSGPYKQKLTDFFAEKEPEMEESGKNEYVLTTDEVEDYSPIDIKKSFRNFGDDMMETGGFKKI
jgi:hypothetical protein